MDIAHDWVEGPVALGARGGAQEEVGVGTSTGIAAVPMMAVVARNCSRCPGRGPCAAVSGGGDCGRPSR